MKITREEALEILELEVSKTILHYQLLLQFEFDLVLDYCSSFLNIPLSSSCAGGSGFGANQEGLCRKGMQWHPDKHTEENRELATVEFQKVGAAFTKLQDNDSDSDDEGYDSDDYDDLFDLFAAHFGGFGGGFHFGGGGGSSGGFSYSYVNLNDYACHMNGGGSNGYGRSGRRRCSKFFPKYRDLGHR